MRLARITGRVSASIKSGKLTGVKMLVADYVDAEGEIRLRGSAEELMNNPRVREAYFGH